MQLPNELQALIGALVVWLVVNGLKALSEMLGRDLNGWATVVAAILTATVVFFINQILAQVPASQQPILQAFFSLLILLLGSMGIKRFEVKTLRRV